MTFQDLLGNIVGLFELAFGLCLLEILSFLEHRLRKLFDYITKESIKQSNVIHVKPVKCRSVMFKKSVPIKFFKELKVG